MTEPRSEPRSGSRGLQISFERERHVGVFELLDHQAPRTVELLLDVLPVTLPVHHCIAAGCEVFALLPAFSAVPPRENEIVVPVVGDLWFIHLPSEYATVPPGTTPGRDGIFDLAIWYGRDSWTASRDGTWITGCHVGRLLSDPRELARACEGVWLHGTDTATIEAVTLGGPSRALPSLRR